ncbi:MAG: HAMP domain-containing sensor histidine kinase [Rhodothermales bacterium]|nr:HAMP domain-containing sensor histidine kinase [Rhodothermales bacterium]
MNARPAFHRHALVWLAVVLVPMALLFGGTLSEYALPTVSEPGSFDAAIESGEMEEIARLGRWIATVPHARIVFPGALILSVWLMSLIIAYGRARYIERKARKAEARLYDELVNRSRVGYLAVDALGKVAATNPALDAMLESEGDWQGASVSEIGLTMDELIPGEVVVVQLRTESGRHVSALASTMSGDDDIHTQIIITPLQDKGSSAQSPAGRVSRNQALLRNINHELRTPLSIILGSATLLESDVSGENADLVDAIRVGGERLLNILETLVLLSELEASDIEDQVGSVDLVHVLEQSLETHLTQAEERGLSTHVNLPSERLRVKGNAKGIEHICGQLIDNAVKFTEGGTISVDCRRVGGRVRISVVDTGSGMDPETLRNALADFRDEKKSRRTTGSIGLSLAKLLADEMGGELELQSAPGRGTTATATFPLAPAATTETDVSIAA